MKHGHINLHQDQYLELDKIYRFGIGIHAHGDQNIVQILTNRIPDTDTDRYVASSYEIEDILNKIY